MRAAELLLTLFLAAGCTVQMGQECDATSQCEGEGICLKGVCSGYACAGDADCAEGLSCGQVGGSPVCVQDCADDADCLGATTCVEIEQGDQGDTAAVCL